MQREAAVPARDVKKKKRFGKNDLQLTLLAAPALVWYLLFCYLPMFGVIIAFKDFTFQPGHGFLSNLFTSPWSGLKNFEFLFRSNDSWLIFRNTLGYNLIFIVLGVAIPATLAILITQLHSGRLAKATQTLMFLPYFMSWVVVTFFVDAFLNYQMGLVNTIREGLGAEAIQWYMAPEYWPWILVVLNVWKSMGYGMVIYMATITGIDAGLYEAALIDGASRWQQIRYITVPILRTTMVIMFILNVGRIFYSDFGLFYQVPRGSPSLYDVTETMDVYVWRALSDNTNISLPSAAAFIQSVVGCAVILLANAVVRKIDEESALI